MKFHVTTLALIAILCSGRPALAQTCTLSGKVSHASRFYLSGVQIYGCVVNNGQCQTDPILLDTTDMTGSWSWPFSPCTSGVTVTFKVWPSKSCFTFSPASRTETATTPANVTGLDFDYTQLSYTISGTVKNAGGAGIPGVAMNGPSSPGVTGAGGSYTVTAACGWSGSVTPSLAGYTFNPPSRPYSSLSANAVNQDYTGYARSISSDMDGDRKSDTTVWRAGSAIWYTLPSATPGSNTSSAWGLDTDAMVAADYDGDGKTDIAVWRPSSGTWYIRPGASPGTFTSTPWGMPGDVPVPADYAYG